MQFAVAEKKGRGSKVKSARAALLINEKGPHSILIDLLKLFTCVKPAFSSSFLRDPGV
jgi:hypothetical protein